MDGSSSASGTTIFATLSLISVHNTPNTSRSAFSNFSPLPVFNSSLSATVTASLVWLSFTSSIADLRSCTSTSTTATSDLDAPLPSSLSARSCTESCVSLTTPSTVSRLSLIANAAPSGRSISSNLALVLRSSVSIASVSSFLATSLLISRCATTSMVAWTSLSTVSMEDRFCLTSSSEVPENAAVCGPVVGVEMTAGGFSIF